MFKIKNYQLVKPFKIILMDKVEVDTFCIYIAGKYYEAKILLPLPLQLMHKWAKIGRWELTWEG